MNKFTNIGIGKPPFTRGEIDQVIRIHRTELSGGFLSSLGDRALRLLFEHAASCPTSVLLVARTGQNREIGAFLLGTINTGAFYNSFFLRKGVYAVFQLLPKLLSFKRIFRVMETLLYPRQKAVQDLPDAELLDIAVSGTAQGMGVGRQLFNAFCEELRDRGVTEFRITTGEELKQAHRFYEKLGAERVDDIEVHSGSKTFVFIYRIPNMTPSEHHESRV